METCGGICGRRKMARPEMLKLESQSGKPTSGLSAAGTIVASENLEAKGGSSRKSKTKWFGEGAHT